MHGWIRLAAAAALVACGGGQTETNAPHPADQVAWGQQLYADKCASCHGKNGEGEDGPALVGKNALPLDPPASSKLRKSQFHTAKDVYDFVKKAMPPKNPNLSDDEVSAIIAFDLKANGVDVTGKHVDATSASSFVLHP